jgi:hypothetical protein
MRINIITVNVMNVSFMQLLKRADDLENYRKASDERKAQKTPHEVAVEQYAAYATTQMHLIPQEAWFKFTLDNMNMIHSFINRRQSQNLPDVNVPTGVQSGSNEASNMQPMQTIGFNMQHMAYSQRGPTPNILQPSQPSFVSSNYGAPSTPVTHSFMTTIMPSIPASCTVNTISPSSYMNVASGNFAQLSGQQLMSPSSGSIPLASTNVATLTKQSSGSRAVTSTDTSHSDVISFTDQLFD